MDATDLCYLPAVEQKALLEAGELRSAELVAAQIARIERHNPRLNAFVTLCLERALDQARRRDDERRRARLRGPLHGLTVGVKDCFATAGLRTTFASKAFENHVPEADHLVVEREKAAGAIVLGKLNTPELTMASPLCANALFGATRNPHGDGLAPGASSGGSGAALAAGLCSLADGSDIGGSLRNPAAWCNVVGHRPSSWMVPDVPSPMPWHNMNTPGPMARSVADAALFLSVLAGPDPRAPVAVAAPFAPGLPPLRDDLEGLRIGWSCDLGSLEIEAGIRANFEAQRAVFEGLGATVEDCDIDVAAIVPAYELLADQRMAAEAQAARGRGLDPGLEARCRALRRTRGEAFMAAEDRRQRLWRDISAALARFDALLWPDDPCDPFPFDDEAAAEGVDWTLLCVSPLLGLPTTTVPCGFSAAGTPRGLQVVGRPGGDLATLSIAHAYERATGFARRRPPLDG